MDTILLYYNRTNVLVKKFRTVTGTQQKLDKLMRVTFSKKDITAKKSDSIVIPLVLTSRLLTRKIHSQNKYYHD